MSIIALARMREDEIGLQLMLPGGTALWMGHDAMQGLWIALAADVAAGVFGIVELAALLCCRAGQEAVPAMT